MCIHEWCIAVLKGKGTNISFKELFRLCTKYYKDVSYNSEEEFLASLEPFKEYFLFEDFKYDYVTLEDDGQIDTPILELAKDVLRTHSNHYTLEVLSRKMNGNEAKAVKIDEQSLKSLISTRDCFTIENRSLTLIKLSSKGESCDIEPISFKRPVKTEEQMRKEAELKLVKEQERQLQKTKREQERLLRKAILEQERERKRVQKQKRTEHRKELRVEKLKTIISYYQISDETTLQQLWVNKLIRKEEFMRCARWKLYTVGEVYNWVDKRNLAERMDDYGKHTVQRMLKIASFHDPEMARLIPNVKFSGIQKANRALKLSQTEKKKNTLAEVESGLEHTLSIDYNLDTTIKELYDIGKISRRTFNCLNTAGIKTIGQIINQTPNRSDLLKLHGFGKKSLEEINAVFDSIVYETVDNPQIRMAQLAVLGEKMFQIITEAYPSIIKEETEITLYLKTTYPHPYWLHQLVMGEPNNLMRIVENFSREDNIKIRHKYKQFIELVLDGMKKAQETENELYKTYMNKNLFLANNIKVFSDEQIAKYFLTPLANRYLEEIYQEYVNTQLSVRSRNFVHELLPHFVDLIKYAEEPLSSYHNICIGRTMKKTLTEIYQFNQKFKKSFDYISRLSDDSIRFIILKRDYPYLENKHNVFVNEFMKQHNHAPLFFLLHQYLRKSKNRSNMIYGLLHGIRDAKQLTLSEVADALGLTRERVRQIAHGRIEIQDSALIHDDGWAYYRPLFSLPIIYEKTNYYIKLCEEEKIPENFVVFSSLVTLVADFKLKEVNGYRLLINNKIEELNLNDYLNKLDDNK